MTDDPFTALRTWTREQLDVLTAPNLAARPALDAWLAAEGVTDCTATLGGGFVECHA